MCITAVIWLGPVGSIADGLEPDVVGVSGASSEAECVNAISTQAKTSKDDRERDATARTDAGSDSDLASREFKARLEAADTAMAVVKDLRADFEQRRHTPLLKKPMVSRGVVYSRGDKSRWQTTHPQPSSMLIAAGSIEIYYPNDKLLEIYPVDQGFRDLAGAPLPRLSVLRERFHISALAPTDPQMTATDGALLSIQLIPKDESLRQHIASVKVFIDESVPAAKRIVMTDPDGEVTVIVFSEISLNMGVTDDEIDPPVAKGVRVSRPFGPQSTGSGASAGPVGTGGPGKDGAASGGTEQAPSVPKAGE